MPASYNKTQTLGNLTRDPDLRHTPKGTAVANLGVAVNQKRPDGNGGYTDDTVFLDVTVWGVQAENCCKFLKKGRSVFIEGRLATETWDDKETGKKRSKLKIVADNVQFLNDGKRGEGETTTERSQRPRTTAAGGPVELPGYQSGDDPDIDDDIPF